MSLSSSDTKDLQCSGADACQICLGSKSCWWGVEDQGACASPGVVPMSLEPGSKLRVILFNNPCIMTEVNAVQIPAYNKSDPVLWFIMCESTFALATPKPITESITKYNYIVSHIPPDIASLVRDILIKPDATDPYGNLKTELINRSGESSTQEIRQLLSGEELGSRRPSELLRNMTRRAETFNVPEKLMLELFLQRLPSRVQSILAAVSDLTLAKAAEISDRIFEVTPTPVETYAISGASATTTEDRLFREIEKLNKRIDSLSFSRSRSPYRYNKHYHRNNRSKSRDSSICWYHRRFGKRCKEDKCVKPCSWQGNNTSKE
ncbi:uncharacterized protein TNCV_3974491 [Trichonephila clavipes]|nr:uncharacterized protein TNCV_3974491 [Trichonephila clavipes]